MTDYRRVTHTGRRPTWVEVGRDTRQALVGYECDNRGRRLDVKPFRLIPRGVEVEIEPAFLNPFGELEVRP